MTRSCHPLRPLTRPPGSRLLLWCSLLLAAGGSSAQQQPVGPPVLEISFANPGARSLGFGGAFVALADDATAAFANPAGLVQLLEPEVSIEGRSWSYSTPFTVGGRIAGRPSGIGLDTAEGLRTARSADELTGLAFLSFVYPKGRGSLAVFRHQLANFESTSETQGLFGGDAEDGPLRFLDRQAAIDLEVINYGLAGAYRVSETLSLGAGLSYFEGSMLLTTATFRPDDDSVASLFAENSYLPQRNFARTAVGSHGTDWGLSGGFLWSLSERWSLGGAYRQGPVLQVVAEVFAGPAISPELPPGSLLARAGSEFALPDVWGIGLSYRSRGGRLAASFEWDRVENSDVIDHLSPEIADPGSLDLDDGDELHLGAEYAFLQSIPLLAVRLGVWLDPDHRLRSRGDDPFARALLQPGDDELHLALGLGLAFERIQLDLATDFSDMVDTVSLSAIYSF